MRLFTYSLWLCLLGFAPLRANELAQMPWLAPTETVFGKAQSEFVVKWWQWLYRMPDGVRPHQDPTGNLCPAYQSGNVWFLAGTNGGGAVTRRCAISANQYVFLPIFAQLKHATVEKPQTCEQLKVAVAVNESMLVSVEVLVDDTSIDTWPALKISAQECFDPFLFAYYLKNRELLVPAASEGYWLMLKPLSPGAHSIVVRVKYKLGPKPLDLKEQQFRYELEIQSNDKNGQDSVV